MALNWNASDCPAMQDVWEWDNNHPDATDEQMDERSNLFAVQFARLDDMIWASLMVEAGSLTENTADKWAERLYIGIGARLWSPVLYEDNRANDKEWLSRHSMVAFDDVKQRVDDYMGLTVNVAPISDAAWWKKVRQHYQREIDYSRRKKERV